MNPPSLIVSAAPTGSNVTRSPTSQRSRTSPSGRIAPRTCNAIGQSYPITGSSAPAGDFPQPISAAGPGRQVEGDPPGIVDGDQLVGVPQAVVAAVRVEHELRERHPLGQR